MNTIGSCNIKPGVLPVVKATWLNVIADNGPFIIEIMHAERHTNITY